MAVNELFAQLHEVASSPKKQLDKYLAEGKKVVAVAPVYTPQEIIHSMGLVPMGVWGADMEINEAKKYYPAFICSIMQTILELGIKGEYDGVSAIVIPSLCDSLKTLGQNWKYAVKGIPFVPMTYPQNRKPAYGIKFTKAGYARVISDLTIATGAQFSEFALADSIKVYNEHNAVMREFAEIAADAEITAAQRSDVFKSAWFMLPEEHTAIVKQLNEELKAGPKAEGKVRVLVSGILADSPNLLKIFDDNGIKVVFDDVAHESRQYKTDVPDMENPVDALAQKFADMDNCTLLYDRDKKRVDYIIEQAKKHNAQGVIVLMTKFCDPEEFDYVPIKRACEAAGLMNLNIEVDRQMVNYEQANTMIQAFKEMF
ncbi:2-hydroxyacyl-CoA dehydratase subunit D [Lacrimispora sp. 210928-DFI.3.58]|uniref:2-hydroxyacyl-CoA dehydratase subunit D n=1 Tax=Lacrimispora sp. 210928-DFI.3.58 TaxID=2883214 RepID=UPI0015B41F64|nr:2-hydroxyacyl-CoA dehydratase family protein [Lacrimispora sp. 210928-DFI.3.58]MCB7321252.1 2-hydroxyacyl-CoA dehydratase family protein [Lacrimispora sp. 210928-DFI.3.58]